MGYYIPDHAFYREAERIGFPTHIDIDVLLDIFSEKILRDTHRGVSSNALRYAAYDLFSHMESYSLYHMNPTIIPDLEEINFSRFNRREQGIYEDIYRNIDFGRRYDTIVNLINMRKMDTIFEFGFSCFPDELNYNEFSDGYCGYHKDECDDSFDDEDYDDYDYDDDEDYDDFYD